MHVMKVLLQSWKSDRNLLVERIGYSLTTCGAKGRVGPHQNQCTNAYQDGLTKVQVMSQGRLSGVQVWTVPITGLYT